jgi:hypothetical protein
MEVDNSPTANAPIAAAKRHVQPLNAERRERSASANQREPAASLRGHTICTCTPSGSLM